MTLVLVIFTEYCADRIYTGIVPKFNMAYFNLAPVFPVCSAGLYYNFDSILEAVQPNLAGYFRDKIRPSFVKPNKYNTI